MLKTKYPSPQMARLILLALVTLLLITPACSANPSQPSGTEGDTMASLTTESTKLPETTAAPTRPPDPTVTSSDLPPDLDIADYIDYQTDTHSLYIAGLKLYEEFSTPEFGFTNEGSANLDQANQTLDFRIRVATGSVTGALDGPQVSFTLDLASQSIIDKAFEPAPDFGSLGLDEFAHYSLMVIELDEARMVEIGQFFALLLQERAGGTRSCWAPSWVISSDHLMNSITIEARLFRFSRATASSRMTAS